MSIPASLRAWPSLPGTVPPAPTEGAAIGTSSSAADGFAALVAQLVAGGGGPSPAPAPLAAGQDDAEGAQQDGEAPEAGEPGDAPASTATATLVAPTVLTGLPIVPVLTGATAPVTSPTAADLTAAPATTPEGPAGSPGTTPPRVTPATGIPDAATAPAASGAPGTNPTPSPAPSPAATLGQAPATGTSDASGAQPAAPPVGAHQPGPHAGGQTEGQGGQPSDPQATQPAPPAPPTAAPTAAGGPTTPVAVTAPAPTVLPTATAEAAPVPGGAVTRQVLPEIGRLVNRGNGTHRVTLTLQPEQLGEVRVTLTVRQGEVHVSLAAGDEARRALAEGAPELRRVLELAGATDTRVVVRDLAGSTTAASTAATAPSPYGDAAGGARGEARGDTAAPGHGRDGSPDQHAGTRGGTTARDGVNDGTEHRSRPEPVRPARSAGVDLTM